MDLQESLIPPIDALLTYGIDKKDVKLLRDANIWDKLLSQNDKKKKSLLSEIQDLSTKKADNICKAVNKIRISLIQAKKFVQSSRKIPNDFTKEHSEVMRSAIYVLMDCFEKYLSVTEIHEILAPQFGLSHKQTDELIYCFTQGKEGSYEYLKFSLLCAEQRRLEKLSLEKDKIPELTKSQS